MALPGRTLQRADLRVTDGDPHLNEEWLVTNGLGGYASGTVAGALTRRYHGLLIAALPNPLGRTMTLNALSERIRLPNRDVFFTWAERTDRRQPARHACPSRVSPGRRPARVAL